MDTQPGKEFKETSETPPKESSETLSPQGVVSIQGVETESTAEKVEPSKPPDDARPPSDPNPPVEHRPATTDGTEIASATKIETGVEKPEKEHYSYRDNEIGGLHHRPSGPEGGG